VVVIRLTRIGKKKQAFYRIVVADSKRPVKAKFIKILGWYNPHSKELNIKTDEINDWLAKGAQPSVTVAKLLKSEGIKLPKWVEIKEKKKKPKGEKPAEKKKETIKEASEETKESEEAKEVEETAVPEADKAEDKPAEE